MERKCKTDRDLYDVEVVEVDTTRKRLKIHFVGFSHEYDEWRGVITILKVIIFLAFAWRKCFFRKEVSLEDRGNIFYGQKCFLSSFLRNLFCSLEDKSYS